MSFEALSSCFDSMAGAMENPERSAEAIRQKIEALLTNKDFRGAVVECEELEILTAPAPFGDESEKWAKLHLALLLILDDVNNGRHLWRRLPSSAKSEGGEIAALWGVGKCLWKREMQGAQAALRGREWGADIAPFVALLQERLWERQVNIMSKAFTSLPLERVASMLGCSADDAEKECAKRGWAVEAGGSRIVKPTCGESTEPIPSTTPDHLQKMARHIAFLERQNQG